MEEQVKNFLSRTKKITVKSPILLNKNYLLENVFIFAEGLIEDKYKDFEHKFIIREMSPKQLSEYIQIFMENLQEYFTFLEKESKRLSKEEYDISEHKFTDEKSKNLVKFILNINNDEFINNLTYSQVEEIVDEFESINPKIKELAETVKKNLEKMVNL